jgi:hypothetical protein
VAVFPLRHELASESRIQADIVEDSLNGIPHM